MTQYVELWLSISNIIRIASHDRKSRLTTLCLRDDSLSENDMRTDDPCSRNEMSSKDNDNLVFHLNISWKLGIELQLVNRMYHFDKENHICKEYVFPII